MKSIKFLAALAVPAMFAACTNEELVAVQQEVQQVQEFVGAELIGKGISFNVDSESESRISAAGKWTSKDKLGLGWVVRENYSETQTEADPNKQELFGNHLFYYNEETRGFETMANIYTGWHFAYFPFTHMAKLGEVKTVTVNPVQKENWETDRFNTCLQLTARAFLSPANLDEETYQLKDVRFVPIRAFNTIGINIQPNETFTKNPILSGLKVESMKLYVGAGVFANAVELQPTHLATMQYDENGEYSEDLTKTAVKASLQNVLKVKNSKMTSTTTKIENASIDLTGDQYLRIHALSQTATIKPENVVFTINVQGGVFTVGYVAEPGEDKVALNNNATIEKLVAAYAKEGEMTQVGGVLYKDMNLQLTADMFQPATDAIDSEEKWNHAVNVVTALGKKDVTFNIVEGENGPWSFVDVDGDGNLINLPEGANVTVTGENMILAAEGNWPAEGLVVNTGVVVNGNLTVADEVEMAATKGIVNNAFITGGYKTAIKGVENKGEIKVIYGTFVTVANNQFGVISYDVPAIGSIDEAGKELTEARIQQRIEYLIARTGNEEYATVNKLNVNNGVSLNLSKQTVFGSAGTPSDEDLYRPSKPGNPTDDQFELIPSLDLVSLELNGGTVTTTLPATLVKAVVNGGTLSNVSLTEGLSATEATITATSIKGGVEATKSIITVETIEGGLTATETNITATSIKDGVEATKSSIIAETISEGLIATEATITAESINGAIVLNGTTIINSAEITGNVTVETGTTTLNNININGDLMINAGAKVIIAGKDAKINNIDNYGELTTSVNVYTETVEIFKGSKAEIADNKVIWYNTPSKDEYGYTQEGWTHGYIKYSNLTYVSTISEINAAIEAGDKKIFLNAGEYKFDASKLTKETELICANGTVFTGTSNLNVNGATIVGATFSNPTDAAVKNKINGTFKGCTFEGSNAMRYCYTGAGKTALFEDCVFDAKSVYAIHFDGTEGADIIFKNCKITGWVAIAGGHNSLLFEGCEIYGNGTYGLIRTYGNATIKDCTFDVDNVNKTDQFQDGIHAVGCVVTVENCVNVNGGIEALFNISNNGEIIKK